MQLAFVRLKTLSLVAEIATELMKEGAKLTVLSTLLAALALPAALLTASDLIDSKWATAIDRHVSLCWKANLNQ